MKLGELSAVLQRFVPTGAEQYCAELLVQHAIQLHIKRPRSTKFGDYRLPMPGEPHRISINKDLNRQAFLVTFLHEVAHLTAFERYGRRISPHGAEWKSEFQRVSQPVFQAQWLPQDVQAALARYLRNPKASSCSDPHLYKVLHAGEGSGKTLLDDLHPGQEFAIKDGRRFQALEKKRTRWRCKELGSGKIFLVPGLMEVQV
ncbi:MAG: SprT-like domain-containing protein [Bacteroidia bacterium]